MDHKRNIIMCLTLAAVFNPVFGKENWKATVVQNIEALVSSCVVLPCTFTHPGSLLPNSRLRGIWHRKHDKNEIFYHEDSTMIQDSFKGRTQLLGHLGQKNCTLEIVDVKDHDNGPFCFRVELVEKDDNKPTSDKFSFVEECAEIKMLHETPKPKMGPLKSAVEGKPYTVTCSIRHTCSSHWPEITWSRGSKDEINEVHRDIHGGIWETESILAFIPEEKDDHTDLTCTATFYGGKRSSTAFMLNVKRTEKYNHIIIPVVAVAATAVIFGLVCVLMVKKYKKRIQELQSQDGSMWNRMSRLSRRLRSGASGPARPDQRSIWSRFSRRPERNEFNQSPNNATSYGGQTGSKPRCPSPKRFSNFYCCCCDGTMKPAEILQLQKDIDDNEDYMNTADLNVYGNV